MRWHRVQKRSAQFTLLLLALILSSCGRVRLTSPLTDPDEAKPDERLCGVWKPKNKKQNDSEDVFLFIGKVGQQGVPSGIMKAVLIGIDSKKNTLNEDSFYFFTTSADDINYANLIVDEPFNRTQCPTWDKRKIEHFALFKYKVGENRLTLWNIKDDAVEAAIRKGRVKGKIGEQQGKPKVKIVTLTDGADLLRFLTKGGDKEFFAAEDKDALIIFSRVKSER